MLLTFLHIIPSLFSAPDDLSVSDDMEKGVINSITIEGVKGEGDYDLSDNKSDNKWDLSNSTAAGSYTVSFDGEEGKVEGQRALTGGKNDKKVLMMIPQELGGGAKVTINFTPTGRGVKEASFSLGGTTWEPGRHITYVLSTTKLLNLNMGTITYPDGWKTVDKIKSTYTDGDSIGMYVVDKYNKVIEANLKFTYNGNDSKWTVESGKEFKGSPQYNYFVYYPYQEGGLPGAPAKGTPNINVTSAENFFDDAIDTWKSSKITADQSTLDMMNACDLQIGKASLDEDGCSVSFKMEHAMGLAVLNRETKSVPKHYILSGYSTYTWDNGTTTLIPSATLSNSQKLYATTNTQGVKVIPPSVASTFSSTSTGNDAWSDDVNITAAANGVGTGTAKIKATKVDYTYTMEVGDIYYSDGAMTHQSEALASGKTPIGIVGYLGNDYWTEKNTKEKEIGGHALVMCLKTIGSTGKTSIGTGYAWYSSNSDAGRTRVDGKDKLVNSYKQSYGSGYTETDALITKWGSAAAAAYQAKNYSTLPAPSSKCTGWFLPTAGQYYAVMTNLGAPFSDDWTGILDGNTTTHPNLGFFSNMTTVTKNINDKLKTVGDSNYTEFFGSVNTWAWTSSEFSSALAVGVDSGVDDSKGSGSVRFFSSGKTSQRPVRPFLAF